MMEKVKFHEGLEGITRDIYAMGEHALGMLVDSVRAFKEQDLELADQVEERKHQLAFYDRDIEERALQLLTLHQPMARDLRTIATILKMDTYLTRIGRYAKDISKATRKMGDRPHLAKLVMIPKQAELVAGMVRDALTAFREDDASLIADFTDRDDEVDAIWSALFRECATYMMEDPANITPCTHYILVSWHLERCGDHACKIAEKVHYKVTGEHIEIK
jgi:phosphate transport system protein